jgi:cytochrome c oxidase assembly protein subunit 15
MGLAGGGEAARRADFSDQPVDRAIVIWLIVCCAMIFVMVIIGGLTRLTHSGLSMVEWRPLTGFLPPLSTAEWEEAFARYREFPEYRKLNQGMTLEAFKSIFWFEFAHRVWGRLIGVVFLVPFLWFLVRGRIARAMAPRFVIMFILGGLQGVLGWYMVRSGLVDRPDVSQYRLTAHLGAAFLIYGFILWVALDLARPTMAGRERAPPLWWPTLALAALVTATALSGGLVAGLDAGFIHNTFPLMDDRIIPRDIFMLEPWTINFFEHDVTVQFDHRVLAIATGAVAVALWFRARTAGLAAYASAAFHALAAMTLVQVGLGIATLLTVVAVPVAAAHQAGAMVLFTIVLWALHALRAEPAD